MTCMNIWMIFGHNDENTDMLRMPTKVSTLTIVATNVFLQGVVSQCGNLYFCIHFRNFQRKQLKADVIILKLLVTPLRNVKNNVFADAQWTPEKS